MKMSDFISFPSVSRVISLVLLFVSLADAQETKPFAAKGCVELGGNVSYESATEFFDGQTFGGAVKIFNLQPYVGYFVTDGFEVGVNPLGIEMMSVGNSPTTTQAMIFAAPSYNFKTQGNSYPFIEALLGYTSSSGGSSAERGFSWGFRGGVKIAVVDHALVNLGLTYLQVTMNPSGATSRTGYNEILISGGFSFWL